MGFSADIDIAGGGAGSSLSVNGGKTNLNSDYKAVGEQSGIFTGDDGLDLTAGGKTTLIGGAITTTKAARDAGRNRYTSADGIKTQDINNTTSYDGNAIQAGLSLGQTDNKPQASMNGLGYGSDSDSDSSVTRAGITGIAGSQDITTDNRAEYAGILENSFDANQVNKELGAQTQITQAFDQERRKIKTELNQEEEKLRNAAKKALENGDRDSWEAYSQEADKIQQKSLIFDGISGALYGPNTNGAVGYVAKAISPQIAYQIGEAFKNNDFKNAMNEDNELAGVGSPQHILAHAILGAAVSAATGNDALIGGTSAAVGEGQALLLSKYLYDTKDPSELTAEQKDTISSIASLAGLAMGASTGEVTDAVNAGETALVAVQDNGLENVLLPHEIDEIKNNPNYSREQLEAFQRMPEMIGDLDIVYKKNNKGNFIVCVPYSGNSCAPRSNERYATPDEIRQGAQDFALDVVPIPGSKGAAIVVKKTGQVIGKYKDARSAKKAADEAVQKARVTNNNQIDDDLGNKPSGRPEYNPNSNYNGGLVKVPKPDPDADALATRIGGESRVRFKNDNREFDVISDKYIGQAKPANYNINKTGRDQAKATFDAARDTGRKVYYHFDGPPNPNTIRKLEQYSKEYNIPIVIDIKPF